MTPIQKEGAEEGFNRVRPIMLISVFSKLYESFLTDWLKSKIEEFIDQKQFGNQYGLSTTHYLVSLLDTIYNKS